ncbi:MAG: glycerophosphodiester phosphodiesterase [Tenericutes bacterium HGW-Tenericutes-1]|jgi:glycerophosphoryl diester phosphodiesterase|nr:MAG: glycerophosphodiester phosphodiesterase [Tenericutes bacterium HGW-Tenericutes-1]
MKDLNWIKNGLFTHRGLHTLDKSVPENTLTAFKNAIAKSYGIEMDVNQLKDGTIVVFHDKNLLRLCGVDLYLKDLNFEDLKEYRILNTEEKIYKLEDILKIIDGKVPLLIELKPFGEKERFCSKFMEVMDTYHGQWAMHSFHPAFVAWFKKNRPEVIRGQISEYFEDDPKMNKINKFLMKHLWINLVSKPDFINYGIHNMPNIYLNRAQKHGTLVIGYAARSQEEFDKVRKYYSNPVFEFFEPKL